MLHAVLTVKIYGGCLFRAILSMELPEIGNVGKSQLLFLGMEGGSKGGPILTMELPERGDVGKEPDAVPWNERRVQGWSYSYHGIA